jgi:hypothetical protein
MMDKAQKDHLRLGLADLRSGKYPQDKGYLRTDKGFCCLGVFCDRFHKETGQGNWIRREDGKWFFAVGGYDESSALPSEVARWYGLASNPKMPEMAAPGTKTFGSPDAGRLIISAAEYNDWGVLFPDIADVMEASYLEEKQ